MPGEEDGGWVDGEVGLHVVQDVLQKRDVVVRSHAAIPRGRLPREKPVGKETPCAAIRHHQHETLGLCQLDESLLSKNRLCVAASAVQQHDERLFLSHGNGGLVKEIGSSILQIDVPTPRMHR